jgi:hypothetical protein
VTGFVLSLGPSTPVYRIAYRVVLPLQGLRVSARFGYLVLLAVALLAAYGTAWLERRTARRSLRVIVSVLAIAAVNLEAWHGPVMTTPFRGVPRIYRLLDAEPQPVLLMEAPFWPAQAMFGNAEYVLNATEHRAPIANGYSGFTPDAYRRRAQWFWFFPEPWAIATLRPEGITHVMVHLEQFGAEAPGVVGALLNQRDLELVAAEGDHRLYRLKSR